MTRPLVYVAIVVGAGVCVTVRYGLGAGLLMGVLAMLELVGIGLMISLWNGDRR